VVIVFGAYVFHWGWIIHEWNIFISIMLSILVSVLIGLAMNEFIYELQRKRKAKKLAYLISTIALLMLGTSVVVLFFGSGLKSFNIQTQIYRFQDLNLTFMQLVMIAVSIVLLLVLAWIFL